VPVRRDGSGEGQGVALPKHAAMTWAQRLKRVFGIEIERCEQCGCAVKIIASIEDPQLIGRILAHLGLDGSNAHGQQLPPARAPPIGSSGLFVMPTPPAGLKYPAALPRAHRASVLLPQTVLTNPNVAPSRRTAQPFPSPRLSLLTARHTNG